MTKRSKRPDISKRQLGEAMVADLVRAGWVKVPPGWRLVPESPRPEQMLAGTNVAERYGDRGTIDDCAIDVYEAMVKAAPDLLEVFNVPRGS